MIGTSVMWERWVPPRIWSLILVSYVHRLTIYFMGRVIIESQLSVIEFFRVASNDETLFIAVRARKRHQKSNTIDLLLYFPTIDTIAVQYTPRGDTNNITARQWWFPFNWTVSLLSSLIPHVTVVSMTTRRLSSLDIDKSVHCLAILKSFESAVEPVAIMMIRR